MHNFFAYADDITIFSLTTTGLQTLLDICAAYSEKWRFNFGILKTKCIVIGKSMFQMTPTFMLNDNAVEQVDSINVLGVPYDSDLKYQKHVLNGSSVCRKSYYGLLKSGVCYPDLPLRCEQFFIEVHMCA